MEDKSTFEILLSKVKLTKLLIFSILFLVGGLWMIIAQPEISNPVFNNFFVKTLASYGGVVMGSLGIFFFTKKLFDKRPGIVIDNQGITDNSGIASVGFIPWQDIDGIYERTIQASFASKERFVTVVLKDPEQYVLNQSNSIKRKLLSINLKSYGSPIHISTNGLKIKHQDLLELMVRRLQAYNSVLPDKLQSTTQQTA